MKVSIPEKTLEHWISLHLNRRYGSKLQQWWPVFGQDITARPIANFRGKEFWLEIKTCKLVQGSAISQHRLVIDLAQLYKYQRDGGYDYYVFPAPYWSAPLSTGLENLSEIDSSRIIMPATLGSPSSQQSYFANWTFVVSGEDLRTHLRASGCCRTQGTKTVFTLDSGDDPRGIFAGIYVLDDFLDIMDQCGLGRYRYKVIAGKNDGFSDGFDLSSVPDKFEQLKSSPIPNPNEMESYDAARSENDFVENGNSNVLEGLHLRPIVVALEYQSK